MIDFLRYYMNAISFGVMDGIITVLGVLIGVSAATENRLVVIAAALTAGAADGFANAAGIHVAEESEKKHTRREVWTSTALCFVSTFLTMLIPIMPFFFLPIWEAIYVSAALGLSMLYLLGLKVGGSHKIAVEYTGIGAVTTVVCYFLGEFISAALGAPVHV